MGRGEVHTGFWWGNLRERDHLEDPGVDGRIILRWIFRNWDVRVRTISFSRTLLRGVSQSVSAHITIIGTASDVTEIPMPNYTRAYSMYQFRD